MSRIVYDRTTIFGKMTAEAVNDILVGTSSLSRLKSTMDDALGSPPVWANLEGGDFGISAGNGEAFYNTIVELWTALTEIPVFTINSIDMGG